jgi:hypothetical protein
LKNARGFVWTLPATAAVMVCLGGLALAAAPSVAAAAPSDPPVLEVERDPDTQSCPDRSALQAGIAERLGRDPFARAGDVPAQGARRVRVSYTKQGASFGATLDQIDTNGQRTGRRVLSRPGATCAALGQSVVLTLSLLFEDLAPVPTLDAGAPPPTLDAGAPPSEGTLPPSSPTAPLAPVPAFDPSARARFDVGLDLGATVGTAPAPALLGGVALGLGYRRLRLELGGRGQLPASDDGPIAARAQLLSGRLSACYGWEVLSPCATLAIGAMRAEGIGAGVANTRAETEPYVATGVGLMSRITLWPRMLFVRLSGEVLFALVRARFEVGPVTAWQVPLAGVSLTAGLGVWLP